jgi:hypothetical protein
VKQVKGGGQQDRTEKEKESTELQQQAELLKQRIQNQSTCKCARTCEMSYKSSLNDYAIAMQYYIS